jgi:hypothetical protein
VPARFVGAGRRAIAIRARLPGDATSGAHSGIRALLDSRAEAMRAKDVDRLMSGYSPDIVYFELVPALR